MLFAFGVISNDDIVVEKFQFLAVLEQILDAWILLDVNFLIRIMPYSGPHILSGLKFGDMYSFVRYSGAPNLKVELLGFFYFEASPSQIYSDL